MWPTERRSEEVVRRLGEEQASTWAEGTMVSVQALDFDETSISEFGHKPLWLTVSFPETEKNLVEQWLQPVAGIALQAGSKFMREALPLPVPQQSGAERPF